MNIPLSYVCGLVVMAICFESARAYSTDIYVKSEWLTDPDSGHAREVRLNAQFRVDSLENSILRVDFEGPKSVWQQWFATSCGNQPPSSFVDRVMGYAAPKNNAAPYAGQTANGWVTIIPEQNTDPKGVLVVELHRTFTVAEFIACPGVNLIRDNGIVTSAGGLITEIVQRERLADVGSNRSDTFDFTLIVL